MGSINTDVVIIGAGPVGLFQAFELGLHGLQSVVVDSLLDIGGQCTQLHPNEPVNGLPSILDINTNTLVDNLWQQALAFDPRFILGESVESIDKHSDVSFLVTTNRHSTIHAKAVIIAGGKGALEPTKLNFPEVEEFENQQVFYQITDLTQFENKLVVVLGDTDLAISWALTLQNISRHVTVIHDKKTFRATPKLVDRMMTQCNENKMDLIYGSVSGFKTENQQLVSLEVSQEQGGQQVVDFDALVVFAGMNPKVRSFQEWDLLMHDEQIYVDNVACQSSQLGTYAVGDVCYYPGKLKRMLSGFHEAASAAQSIANRLMTSDHLYSFHEAHSELGIEHEINTLPLGILRVNR